MNQMWIALIALILGTLIQVAASSAEEAATVGIQSVLLDDQALKQLSTNALTGSGEAAERIANFYLLAKSDRDTALYWATIAAENGNVVGEYNTGFLLKDKLDRKQRIRALFWLQKAAKDGSRPAQQLLESLNRN